ncbi:hypothetical protein E4U61_006681 [Claviceps capensis]|nr:hypothetical protein E4U61_006681 [Claviceps capensis]
MESNPMLLLPSEMKAEIVYYLDLPEILRLGQTCRNWYPSAIQGLYRRDAREHNSCAIKWMAASAIDEQTTDLAIRTMAHSQEFGGELNAIQLGSLLAQDWSLYKVSTALHWAIWLSNVRLTKTLLGNGASPRIPCSAVLFELPEQFSQRLMYFRRVFVGFEFGQAFPIFLAFLRREPDIFEVLLNHGADPEAAIEYDDQSNDGIVESISILHFAAADRAPDFGQLERLFDRFREHINQPCTIAGLTPLHVALKSGSTRGMQIAVKAGADKEARNAYLLTPLVMGVQQLRDLSANAAIFEEHTRCLREFVDLGGNLNPANGYWLVPGHLHGGDRAPHRQADLDDGTLTRWSNNSNVANELILAILPMKNNHPGLMILRQLLLDFVDKGLIFAEPALWLPSPLRLVMSNHGAAQSEWLFAFLTKMEATVHAEEVANFPL